MKDLLNETVDYVLCGYIGDLVCCNANCDDCDDDDKIINRAEYNQKYETKRGKILQHKTNSGKKSKI